ncbi:AraC-like DNA-binding protein [Lactobacillus colini]|uniref:AraC-like DNA-binding protein n=1 Tax=Lactobacillus colini TaxID=1819254 RepID=A0ABS4MG19_9LACO|nr:AraC family transcriptional regulator [Lactobacillus colini]MBP2058307.1 AraC-like DNA-binding protein [Lactobacillus colini]
MKFESIIPKNRNVPYKCQILTDNYDHLTPSWHDTYEIFYLINGTAILQVEGASFELKTGNLVTINPYESHSIIRIMGELLVISFPLFYLKNAGIEKLEYRIQRSIDISREDELSLKEALNYISANINKLENVSVKTTYVGLGYVLIGQLISKYSYKIDLVQLNSLSRRFDYIKVALDYIQTHYAEEINIATLSSLLNLSSSYFSHIFKSTTGETPVANIEKVRLAHAKQLILETNLEMWQIANKTGFASLKAMNRAFKKYYDTTAYQWKKQKIKAGFDLF